MRVVLFAHAYPPYPVVGSLRAEKIARAIRDAGHHVDVITSRLPGEDGQHRDAEEGIEVIPVPSVPNPRHAYLWLKNLIAPNRGNGSSSRAPGPATEVDRPDWQRLLLSLCWLPDDEQGFVPMAVGRALDLIRRDVDLIYTTAPPFSCHLAGLILKQLTGIRWVTEFRDPWTDFPGKPAHIRSRLSDRIERGLERLCLRKADHVVCASESIAQLLAAKLSADSENPFVVVRNGIDHRPSPDRERSAGGPIRIAHVGELYHYRDPRPFLAALASICEEGWGPENLRLEMVGNCRWYHEISVEKAVEELGLSRIVRFRDRVSHSTCQEIIRDADLLLLFAQHQPVQVPNKLYEYLGAGPPVLAIADPDGETARMLREVGGHFIATGFDSESIADVLQEAIETVNRGSPTPSDEDLLRAWSTDRQLDRLIEALGL